MTAEQAAPAAPTFYDVQEVAQMFKMSRMTVYRAISSGELAAVRIRGRWLVPARVIDALVEGATSAIPDPSAETSLGSSA
ncbi:helix-turn-helix domain-containing protein [Pseudonocardia sp. N23]|uniref:helix-turn-helix domain-containing protein n=1 Tax=Pseudonocardia sp. N23 TaxID=1987376 RepID=UPI000BFE2902|nr:helix-turn-helix domain-containing protein [Pseudonocardia sp. N23]